MIAALVLYGGPVWEGGECLMDVGCRMVPPLVFLPESKGCISLPPRLFGLDAPTNWLQTDRN